MAKKISCGRLADEVMRGLEEYAELTADELKKNIRGAGKAALKRVKQGAPRESGAYARSWSVKTVKETSRLLRLSVHAGRYRLTHLLEFGHAKRGGGRTRAFPHIEPARRVSEEQLTRDIEADLRRLL